MLTSKELKEHKNKYLSSFENEREVIISMPVDNLIELIENQEKLKQAIEILKDKMNLAVYHHKVYNTYSIDLLKFNEGFEDKLSQEEYYLLKEVLGNE